MSGSGVTMSRNIRWSALHLLILTILLLPIITAAKPSNLARIIGPIMGKRGETDDFENEVINRVRTVQEQEARSVQVVVRRFTSTNPQLLDIKADLLARSGLDDPAFSCPLDSLFLSLEPQWQDLILEILRLASYEDGWSLK